MTVRVANATPGTGALASIYAVDSTASPIAGSVVTTDSTGTFNFYAPDGRYDLVVGFGVTTKIVADIEIADITESQSGDVAAKFGTLNFTTAFQHNGVPVAAADLSDGNSGTGAIAHVISPVFTTPSLGAATATSLTATAGTPLTLLSGATGTNLSTAWGRTTTEANFGVTANSGNFFTNSDLVPGDFFLRLSSSTSRIYLGAGTGAAPVSITNTGMNLYTTSGTLPASISNDSAGGVQITNNAGQANRLIDVSGNMYISPGAALLIFGGTSGRVAITSPAASGITGNALQAVNDTFVYRATTDTLTNKRVTPRLITVTSAANAPATLAADSDNDDVNAWVLTGTGGTLTINPPSGTPTDGQKLILRVKASNSWTYSFNAIFAFSTSVTAPTTLAAGKTDYIGLMWNATNTKWDVVAVDQGH